MVGAKKMSGVFSDSLVCFFKYLKIVSGIFTFVTIFWYTFERGMGKKNCPRYFPICKYAFFKYFKKVCEKKLS